MTHKTCRPSAGLGAAALACALAGCAEPAPEVVAEATPAQAVPEPTPVEPLRARPAATISLPLGPVVPQTGPEGAPAAPKPQAPRPLASESGTVQAAAAAHAESARTPMPNTDLARPLPAGSGVVSLSVPTAAGAAPEQPLALDDAVLAAANALFANAQAVQSGSASIAGGLALTIDPPVDGSTGLQSAATRALQARVVKLVREQYPRYELKPFTTATLALHPLLLVGTLTPADKEGKSEGRREAFNICLALVDLQNGRTVSRGIARAKPAGVDLTPTRFFADSPVWAPDAATQGYVKTCQATRPDEPISPAYSRLLSAAVLVNDGAIAYETGRYEEARHLFQSVQRMAGGEQLRVLNGLYLASQKLGRRDEAIGSFARLIGFGLAQKQLAIKFLFRPGSVAFVDDPQVSGEYALWLSVFSQVAEHRSECFEISVPARRAGPEPPNERLALMRAQYIKQRIDAAGETIASRTFAVVNPEKILGLGAEDGFEDRVEFRVLHCKAKSG